MTGIKYGAWLALLGITILAGLFTTYKAFTVGHQILGGSDIVPWTLPIATYMFFVLMGTGLLFVASINMLFGVKLYEPLAKRAIFLAITALIAGFIAIIVELGAPWNMLHFMLSPNFSSAMWWMSMLYGLFVVSLLIKFWKMHTTTKWYTRGALALTILVFVSAHGAHSVLGSIFGLSEARPLFYGAFTPLYFLITAFTSGYAAYLLIGIAHYHITRDGVPEDQVPMFNELGKALGIMVLVLLVFVFWRTATLLYAVAPGVETFEHMYHSWPYRFEVWLGLVVPLILMAIPSVRATTRGKVAASALVLLGMLVGRIDFVTVGLVQPLGPRAVGMPEIVAYAPTIWEWSIFAFSLAVMLLLYTLGERYLKLEATPE